jgi:hypothetical protein
MLEDLITAEQVTVAIQRALGHVGVRRRYRDAASGELMSQVADAA